MDTSHQEPQESPSQMDIDRAGAEYTRWRQRNRYYYQQLTRLFHRHVPPGASVLEIGCEAGDLLADLDPACGVGVDANPAIIEFARQRHPELSLHVGGLDQVRTEEKFDAVIICNAVGKMRDVQATFAAIKPFCRPETRVIVTYHNELWEPILVMGSRLGMRRTVEGQNWLSRDDLANLFELAGFQVIRQFCEILMPKPIPMLDRFLNRFLVKFWPFKQFGRGLTPPAARCR